MLINKFSEEDKRHIFSGKCKVVTVMAVSILYGSCHSYGRIYCMEVVTVMAVSILYGSFGFTDFVNSGCYTYFCCCKCMPCIYCGTQKL